MMRVGFFLLLNTAISGTSGAAYTYPLSALCACTSATIRSYQCASVAPTTRPWNFTLGSSPAGNRVPSVRNVAGFVQKTAKPRKNAPTNALSTADAEPLTSAYAVSIGNAAKYEK